MSNSLKSALVFFILSAILIVICAVASMFSPTLSEGYLSLGLIAFFLLVLSVICFLWWLVPKVWAWYNYSPPSPPLEILEVQFKRGNDLFSEEHYDQAIIEYTNAIKLDPKFAGAYYNRGVTYGKKEQYELAIADYNKAIKVYPKYDDAYYNRGLVYGKKGQYDLAIEDLSIVLKLSTESLLNEQAQQHINELREKSKN